MVFADSMQNTCPLFYHKKVLFVCVTSSMNPQKINSVFYEGCLHYLGVKNTCEEGQDSQDDGATSCIAFKQDPVIYSRNKT